MDRRRQLGQQHLEDAMKKTQPLRPLGQADTDLEYLSASKGGIISQLRKNGKGVPSELEAMRRMSQGHRVFVTHEQDERPREIKSVLELHAYTPDQMYTLAPEGKASGGSMSLDGMQYALMNKGGNVRSFEEGGSNSIDLNDLQQAIRGRAPTIPEQFNRYIAPHINRGMDAMFPIRQLIQKKFENNVYNPLNEAVLNNIGSAVKTSGVNDSDVEMGRTHIANAAKKAIGMEPQRILFDAKKALGDINEGEFDRQYVDMDKRYAQRYEELKKLIAKGKAEGGEVHMAKGGRMKEPKSTVKAYKLFRVHPDHPGKLFPLFVDANTPVEMNKWVDAKEGEMANGKVKSKIGALAYRPGWHAGDLPIATHIGEKSDPSLTAPDTRPSHHAWAEVEMPNDVDWQAEATKRGTNAQGKVVPVKAHITDQIPKGGHYRYKTNPNMTGNWLIGGSMKVNKVLTDAEVSRINRASGTSDLPRSQPFKKKDFGFSHGGAVAPEEWMAEEHVNYKAQGGAVNPFDYENPEHVASVSEQVSRHKDFSKTPDASKHLGEMLSQGSYKYIEDPRVQMALRKLGHNAYFTQEKTGKKLNQMVIKKAMGGAVPSINQMRQALMANGKSSFGDIKNVGANEAPNMDVKAYINPDQKRDGIMPVGGVTMGNQPLPVGGVDMSQQGGQQLTPPNMTPPPQQGQPQGAPQGGMPPMPPSMGATNPLQQPPSNILQMTPQGQAMSAMKPPQGMAMGGQITTLGQMEGIKSNTPSVPQFSQGGLDPHPLPTVIKEPDSADRPMVSNENMDNGATNFDIDNFQQMANGGAVQGYASKGKVKQTVQDPQRMAYSGIYGNPKEIAALAASRVAPEDPLLKQLFGVTRADMYQQAHGRQGSPHLGMLPGAAANPKGSMAAQGVMNKKNEQRLIDVMSEARQHQGLAHGMEPWYYMDPLFDRMVQLVGLQKATEEYKKMNALMGMASSSSEVNTEIPRGSLAYFLQNQGRFDEFVKHGGKRDPNRPADFGEVPGHLAHKTAHALPMRNFLTHGAVSMDSPKVPMYIEASGVPATGFQTRTPVGDAHWSRAVGLADTRNKKTSKGKEVVPGQSVSTPEMSDLGPWWQQKIAKKLGMESVPAQALAWGAFSPQTGVTTPIGAPKLELIAKQIGQTAQRLGVSPQTARDLVLTGKERIGMKKGGKVSMDQMQATLTLKKKKAK
jgi:hypothetical protein